MKFLLPILVCIAANLYAANTQGDNRLKISCCANACNDESILNGKPQEFDAGIQATVIKRFGMYKTQVLSAAYTMPADTSRNRLKNRKDSLKYFPKLLTDGMGINFDPKKYTVPNRPPIDTSLTPEQVVALNNMAKQQPDASPKNTATKDSTVNKSNQH
jgi:hypothetical protein